MSILTLTAAGLKLVCADHGDINDYLKYSLAVARSDSQVNFL